MREGTSWQDVCGYIQDTTRSGRVKRRLAHTKDKPSISVKMHFDEKKGEYTAFRDWYRDDLRNGLYSFLFPTIDNISSNTTSEYRFVYNSYPQYSDVGGGIIECTMKWEKIG